MSPDYPLLKMNNSELQDIGRNELSIDYLLCRLEKNM